MEDEDEDFVQEEYDLQVQIEQIKTRLDYFDEFTFFAEQVRTAIRSQPGPQTDPSHLVYKQIIQHAM